MRRLRIDILGGLGLFVDGVELPLAGRKARALLGFLALDGAWVRRERLANLFWADVPERQARNSLRQILFEANEALVQAGCEVLHRRRDEVRLDQACTETDWEQFALQIRSRELPDVRPGCLRRPELLLAGYEDLSPDFAAWVAATRQLAHKRLLGALEQAYDDRDLPLEQRRRFAETALLFDPLHEEACRTVMLLAAQAGDTGTALQTYTALYQAMESQLDTEPSETTQSLVAAIKLGKVAAAVPPVTPDRGIVLRRQRTPVVAVLPLQALGTSEKANWIAAGVSEDIVRILSTLREPAVISSNSTRQLRADQDDLTSTAERLGADYLICGSVRTSDFGNRVAVELVEAKSSTVLWGEAYDLGPSHGTDVQTRIAARIAHALAPRVNAVEFQRSVGFRPNDLDTYHLLLRAREMTFRLHRPSFDEAGALIADALRREPGSAAAHAVRADWFSLRIFQGWSHDVAADRAALIEAGETAIALDPYHARALALLGHNRMLAEHRFEEAEILIERAVGAAPNDSEVMCWSSPTCAYIGRVDDAITRAERAILLSPEDPFLFRYQHFLSIAYYAADRFDEAASWGLRSWRANQNYTSNLRVTIAALWAMDRVEEALPLVERHRALYPDYRAAEMGPRHEFRRPAQRQAWTARLVAAGIT